MKTAEEYFDSLRKLKRKVYLLGEELEEVVDHPMIRPSLNAVAKTYELAGDPQYRELFTAESNILRRRVNRFTHLHQSAEDLVKKVKMLRLMGQKTASCFQRCVGLDAINAVDSVTFEMDRELGTEYHRRFRSYLARVQEEDLVVDGAMTDPKGDRSLSPSRQADPDLYLRVVEKREEGS